MRLMDRSFLLVLIVTIALLGLVEAQFHIGRRLTGTHALGQRELATQFLGQHLAQHFPGYQVVVWSNPFSRASGQPREVYQFEKAGLRGLHRGLGTAVTIEAVVFPELRPECRQNLSSVYIDPATTTPLSYLVAPGALDAMVNEHPGARIIVSLIGLPVNLRQTRTWTTASGKSFALLLPDLRMVGNQADIRQALQSGQIAAVVLNKPGAPPEDLPLGRDLKMEFDQRFLLVTAENADSVLKAFPRLF